jgi:glycosyltransferase 2 family protein
MKFYKLLIPSILTIVLVLILSTQVSFSDFSQIFSKLSLMIIFVGFLLYTLNYVFRAIRLQYLLKNKFGFLNSFKIVSIHNMFNQILPFRTGEFSLIYLLKKKNIDVVKSTSFLILLRIFDLFVVSFFLIFSLIFSWGKFNLFIKNPWILLSVLLLFLVLLIIFLIKSPFFIKLIIKIISLFRLNKFKIFEKINSNLVSLSNYLKNYLLNKKIFFFTLFLSLFVWIFSFMFTYYILVSLGLEFLFLPFIFAISLILIFNNLPVHGILNFGTQESFWAIAFIAIGVDKVLAISSGFVVHILVIIYFLFWGVISYFIK